MKLKCTNVIQVVATSSADGAERDEEFTDIYMCGIMAF